MKSEANVEDLRNKVVSDGTMRPEDLIPKFLGVLKEYAPDRYGAYVKENPEVLDLKGMDDETLGFVVEELFDELGKIAPEGCIFGAVDGDGACYGFWDPEASESKKCEDVSEKDAYAIAYDFVKKILREAGREDLKLDHFDTDKISADTWDVSWDVTGLPTSDRDSVSLIVAVDTKTGEVVYMDVAGDNGRVCGETDPDEIAISPKKWLDSVGAQLAKDAGMSSTPAEKCGGHGDSSEESKKSETRERMAINDYADRRFFDPDEFVKYVRKVAKDGSYLSVDSVVSMDILNKANRMAQKNGYKKMEANKPISCNALVAALQEKDFDVKEDLNGSYRVVAKGDNFDTTDNLLFITTLYPESTSDSGFVSDSAFVRGRVNGNRIVATDLNSVEDIVSVCVDAFGKKTESKKSESLTLKQKELKDMVRYGEAEDITTISDVAAKELKKKGIETVGISRGVYGMNGALLRDSEGKKYVITARSSNLFYFV